MRRISAFFAVVFSILTSSVCMAVDPPCAGFDHWPCQSTLTLLQNYGFIDHGLTKKDVTVKVLQNKKIADLPAQDGHPKMELFQLVQQIMIKRKNGSVVEVIVINEPSSIECTMSLQTIWVISPVVMQISPGRPYLEESKQLIKEYKEIIRKQCEHSEGLPECE